MSKLKYQNQFTLPNGKRYLLNTLKNEEYKVLVQYAEANNKEGLVNGVFSLIEESIEDFGEFDIIEKLYTSIVYCFYNIKTSIDVVHDKFGSQNVPLDKIIANIERCQKKESSSITISGIEIEFGIPKTLWLEDNTFGIDYSSAILAVKKNGKRVVLDKNQREVFVKKMGIRLAPLEEEIRKKSIIVDIFSGIPFSSYRVDLMEASSYDLIFNIFKESLKNFYEMLYTMVEYLKVSYSDFMSMTPIEVSILINRFIEDKEEQKNAAKKKTPLG